MTTMPRLLALTLLAGAALSAQANTPQAAAASAPAQKATTQAGARLADLSHLAPRDAAKKDPRAERRDDHRYDARGVNCSLYPARCR